MPHFACPADAVSRQCPNSQLDPLAIGNVCHSVRRMTVDSILLKVLRCGCRGFCGVGLQRLRGRLSGGVCHPVCTSSVVVLVRGEGAVMKGGRRQRAIGQAVVALMTVLMSMVVADAAAVVDVYRMIQYDLKGNPMGSRRAALNHHTVSGFDVQGADLSRAVVILPALKVNISSLDEFVQNKGLLGGLLLLLPQRSDETGGAEGDDSDEKVAKALAELEQWLVHNTFQYPVYFAYEDENLLKLLHEVAASDAAGRPASATNGGYKLVVSAPEAKKLTTPTITNIQGWLPGLRAEGDSLMLPTIAIVASYDTFGAAPALASGSDSNGSGVAMLLELARLFSRLYANPNTRGRYNLLFGLTSGSPYNYNGTSNWLRNFDQRLRESMEYALCLNSLGSSSDRMLLHVSKPPENAFIQQIFSEIESVAKDSDLTVELKHKKINISNSRVAWEHEQFSRQRITAVTLSHLEEPPELLQRTGGIADIRSVNETVVLRNIKVVAESLARHIYGQQGKQVELFAAGSNLALNPSYVRSWLNLLGRTSRVAPFLGKNAPIINALHKELSQHTKDASLQHETLDSTFLFYDSTKAQLNVYQVASVTFDFIVALAVGSYLMLLFIVLFISTKGVKDFVGIFRKAPSRKYKST
ncbi:uncharacterized protein [Physcomitrium patens]|uniref:uncharacterized protein isoform X2 n=1 Tax=Physcomitrium patens TaxID=3218 RepID=UPI000D17C77C|nr:nicalin-like isoform X2 [Physcomitrium patens]|eukprot:XP_024390763.1 nicalin-like isoform X2 [Physcomitrella patens]